MPEYNKPIDPLLVAWENIPFDFRRLDILLRLHVVYILLKERGITLPISIDMLDERLTTQDLTLICESVEKLLHIAPTRT